MTKVPEKLSLKPLGFRVLVYPDPVEEVSKGGIIITDSRTDKHKLAEQSTGTLVAVGPTAWHAFDKSRGPGGEIIPGKPWASVGDRVCYTRYGGAFIKDPATGETYVLLSDEDVTVGFEETR